MKQYAPIVLFCYNRPEHTSIVLEALSANDLAGESRLFIFSDAPKTEASDQDREKVLAVRKIIRAKKWTSEVNIIEQVTNKGLADSITDGISEVVSKYGKVIVLEDDIVPQKGFLKYMNEALEMYESDDSVMNISAYIYPYNRPENTPDTFFLKIAGGWGWATWKRAWNQYNPDAEVLINSLEEKKLVSGLNIENSHDFFSQLLANKNKSLYTWGVKWYASWFLAGGFNLFPKESIVKNIGFDGTGIHSGSSTSFQTICTDYINVERQVIIEEKNVRNEIIKFFTSIKKPKQRWWISTIKKIPFATMLYRKFIQRN